MRRSKTWKLTLNIDTSGIVTDSYCLINSRRPEVSAFSNKDITLPDEVQQRVALLLLQRPGSNDPISIGHLLNDRLMIVYLTNAEGRLIDRMLKNRT